MNINSQFCLRINKSIIIAPRVEVHWNIRGTQSLHQIKTSEVIKAVQLTPPNFRLRKPYKS